MYATRIGKMPERDQRTIYILSKADQGQLQPNFQLPFKDKLVVHPTPYSFLSLPKTISEKERKRKRKSQSDTERERERDNSKKCIYLRDESLEN